MKPLGDVDSHFWRMQRMARATGTDLVSAFKTFDLSSEEYSKMLTQCRGCSDPGRCDRLLTGLPDREDAPDFCANQRILASLREAGHVRKKED